MRTFGNALFQGAQDTVQTAVGGAMDRIDWEDYNYPWGCNIIHFRLEDVEDLSARSAVRWAHISYWMLFAGLVLNFIGTIILASMGLDGKGITVLYSFLNFIIAGIVGMYTFYNVYKGLATRNMNMSRNYLIVEALGGVFMLISATVSGSNFNGLSGLSKAKDEGDKGLKGFWILWTLIESAWWFSVLGVTCVAYTKVVYNRRYGRPTGTPGIGMMRMG
mmetsp:Transcript_36468/g.115038  ORF Transcript_36468/g.115038 Transcript_36468/m.115038 type:complete len:219 (-) Transcript_36468:188-844(-)